MPVKFSRKTLKKFKKRLNRNIFGDPYPVWDIDKILDREFSDNLYNDKFCADVENGPDCGPFIEKNNLDK